MLLEDEKSELPNLKLDFGFEILDPKLDCGNLKIIKSFLQFVPNFDSGPSKLNSPASKPLNLLSHAKIPILFFFD